MRICVSCCNEIVGLSTDQTWLNTAWKPINGETSAESNQLNLEYSCIPFQSAVEAQNFISRSPVYAVAGKLIKFKTATQNYDEFYLVVAPHIESDKRLIFFIPRYDQVTNTIDKRYAKLSFRILPISDVTCSMEIVEVFLCGKKHLRSPLSKALKWDELNTTTIKSTVCNPRLEKRQRGGCDHVANLRKRQDRSDGSHEVPQNIINRLLAESCTDINESCETKFGIKSKDSGTLCHVVAMSTSTEFEQKMMDTYISDYYVSKFEKAYETIHTPSTIFSAIEAVNAQLIEMKVDDTRCDEVRGAIADKLMEDVSFQIVAEDSVQQRFQSLKTDIDNVIYLFILFNYSI